MLSSVQDIRTLRISRYKPHLHLLADELHRGIITRIGQMDRCILVDIPDYSVMECLFQPFLRNRLSDPFIAGQIALQRSLTGDGMFGRVMSADIVRQKAVKFIKALDLGNMFFVKHFSLKKAFKFPFFSKGFSLLLAGNIMHLCA